METILVTLALWYGATATVAELEPQLDNPLTAPMALLIQLTPPTTGPTTAWALRRYQPLNIIDPSKVIGWFPTVQGCLVAKFQNEQRPSLGTTYGCTEEFFVPRGRGRGRLRR